MENCASGKNWRYPFALYGVRAGSKERGTRGLLNGHTKSGDGGQEMDIIGGGRWS